MLGTAARHEAADQLSQILHRSAQLHNLQLVPALTGMR